MDAFHRIDKFKNQKIIFLIFILVLQLSSCGLAKNKCEPSCENPNRREIFENFSIDKQFNYYRTCPCWSDSISDKGCLREILYKREDILDFLIHILKTETNPDILTDALELLSSAVDTNNNIYAKDIKGREDISILVDKTVAKIPEKDERDLIGKITGEKVKSRKEKLEKLAKEIKEQTKIAYEVNIDIDDEKEN